MTKLVAKVEDHDTFGCLFAGIPSRYGPQASRDKSRFCKSEQEASGDERAVIILEGLKGTDDAEEEELQCQPLSRANSVQDHV